MFLFMLDLLSLAGLLSLCRNSWTQAVVCYFLAHPERVYPRVSVISDLAFAPILQLLLVLQVPVLLLPQRLIQIKNARKLNSVLIT